MKISDGITNYSENKIRKHWLLSAGSLFLFYPIVRFVLFLLLLPQGALSKGVLMDSLAHVFSGTFVMLVIWHCAYRKYGTKLLSFWLFVSPLTMGASIMKALRESGDTWTVSFISFEVAVFLWWFLLSLKMRSVNKAVQERLSLKNTELKQL
jgi:hypothetical protein